MRFVLLFLLCLGCASGAEYQRGAYRPPARAPVRAPATNPTTDAPRYAPPGRAPQPGVYPRTPYTRVLPPTDEPTVFAAENPMGSANRPPEPMIQGVSIPLPDDVEEKDLGHTRRCEATVNEILSTRAPELRKQLAEMFFDYRKCAAFRAWAYCMNIHFGPEPKDQRSRDLVDAIEGALAPFCGDRKTPDFNRDFRGAIEAWAKATLRRLP